MKIIRLGSLTDAQKKAIEHFLADDEALCTQIGARMNSEHHWDAVEYLEALRDDGRREGALTIIDNIYYLHDGQGRCYPEKRGYQGLKKQLRGPLGGEQLYTYIDLKAAHTNILMQMAVRQGKNFPALQFYSANVDACR